MRRSIIRPMLAAALFSLAMRAQAQQRSMVGQVDFGITYAAGYSNYVPTTTFWMQGGSIELAGHIPHGLAVVADITGLHEGGSGSSGVPINLVTDTFGPRYTRVIATRARKHPIALFGQALIGEAHGFSSVFPGPSGASTDALSFALQVGGGTDLALSPHLSLRALQADWLRTQLPNAGSNVQNDLRVAAGIVVHTRASE
jgi:outer membrane immunogenic protein